jgi:tetratricopeptide (TPR) repeat protein
MLPEGKWERSERWYLRLLLEVAILKYQRAELEQALRIIDEGLAIDTEYKQFVAAKGLVLASMGNIRGALRHYDRSLKLDPNYDLALFGKGLIMEMLGNPGEALRLYVRLLRLPDLSLDREEIEARIMELRSQY